MLERAGEIELPPVRRHIRGQCRTGRPRPETVLIDTTSLAMPLKSLGPIEIQPIRRTSEAKPIRVDALELPRDIGTAGTTGCRVI
jgi:hypothetical protein